MRPAKKHLVDRFLCVSNSVALGNALATSGAKTEILPNFIPDDLVTDDSEALPSRSDALPQNDYFLFVGDLTREKGLLTLLAAYEGLADSGISLLLVGRRSQGTPSTLPAGVVLGESWPHDRVVSAFRHARAAILPSEWADPCPTTVLEAMALRTPVVTTALGGMIDMVTDGVSGVVVPPGEAEPLRAAMRRLLTDADLGPRLVAGAAEKVREFTASRVVDRLEDVYREVVDSRPAVRGLQ
jgi:glycosyltransferase involved in cell wall biosynthesis